jgi:hypothetical protein
MLNVAYHFDVCKPFKTGEQIKYFDLQLRENKFYASYPEVTVLIGEIGETTMVARLSVITLLRW